MCWKRFAVCRLSLAIIYREITAEEFYMFDLGRSEVSKMGMISHTACSW